MCDKYVKTFVENVARFITKKSYKKLIPLPKMSALTQRPVDENKMSTFK